MDAAQYRLHYGRCSRGYGTEDNARAAQTVRLFQILALSLALRTPFRVVSWLLTKLRAQRRLANTLVGPTIAARLDDFAELNEKWEDRPVGLPFAHLDTPFHSASRTERSHLMAHRRMPA